jgi:hypothetical protein
MGGRGRLSEVEVLRIAFVVEAVGRRGRRSRTRNLGRTGRRRRGAQEDAMW